MLLQDRLTLVNEEGDDNENNAQVEVDHVYNEVGLAQQTVNTEIFFEWNGIIYPNFLFLVDRPFIVFDTDPEYTFSGSNKTICFRIKLMMEILQQNIHYSRETIKHYK
jgi:hypothetical protein